MKTGEHPLGAALRYDTSHPCRYDSRHPCRQWHLPLVEDAKLFARDRIEPLYEDHLPLVVLTLPGQFPGGRMVPFVTRIRHDEPAVGAKERVRARVLREEFDFNVLDLQIPNLH